MAKYIDKVDLSNLSDVIKKELNNYKKDVYNAVVDTCEQGIKEAKNNIQKELVSLQKGKKEDSKHYRSSFITRKKVIHQGFYGINNINFLTYWKMDTLFITNMEVLTRLILGIL